MNGRKIRGLLFSFPVQHFFDFNLRIGVSGFMLLRPERAGTRIVSSTLEETAGCFAL